MWVTKNKLRRLTYWGLTKPFNASWNWRHVVNLQKDLKSLVEYKVGNGKDTGFWFEHWLNGKSVNDMFPNINMQDADISKRAKVANLWRDGRWKFPDAVNDVAL